MKRKRGAQPGNQNARKHGFYSIKLTSSELEKAWQLINTQNVNPEMAFIRVKLEESLREDPDNPAPLHQASKLLTKWASTKYNFNRVDSARFKASIEQVFGIGSQYGR